MTRLHQNLKTIEAAPLVSVHSWVSLKKVILITDSYIQGSKKVPSGHPGQEDLPAGQVIFPCHLPAGQQIRQAVCQLNH